MKTPATHSLLFTLLLSASAPGLRAQASWVQRTPTSVPPARNSTAMAYDSARDRCVLFGGFLLSSGVLSDTWEWDGTNWSQRSPANVPPARNGHAVAYDASRGRTVMFGGAGGNGAGVNNDVWEWDGNDWLRVATTSAPGRRFNHTLCYDDVRGRVLLFGGVDGNGTALGDTWEWDGTSWTQRLPATSPPARQWHAMAFDSARGRAVVFGGGTTQQPLSDTWEWDGTSWTQAFPAQSPSGRLDTEMVFHAARGRALLFGGFLSLSDTWEWDGTVWVQRPTAAMPSGRYAFGFAYDALRAQAVLFGGFAGGQLSDTWELVSSAPATYAPFGSGCPGTAGVPALAAAPGSLPWLGDLFTARLSRGRASTAVLLFTGFSRTSWLGIPLPLNLGGAGAPLCQLLAPGTVLLASSTDPAGNAAVGIPIPTDGSLVAASFFQQYGVFDPGANGLGLVFSNGGEGVIGAR